MPTELDLRAERGRLQQQSRQALEKIDREGRKLTKNENADFDANMARMEGLDAEIVRVAALEQREREAAATDPNFRGGSPASGVPSYLGDTHVRSGRPIPDGKGFRDLPIANTTAPGAFGRYLRAVATNNSTELRDEFGLDDVPGMLPVAVAADLFDAARAASRVMNAGAQVVPLDEGQVKATALVDDPNPGWRAEHEPIPESAPSVTSVTFDPKSLGVVTKISWEALQDASPSAESLVTRSIAEAFALEWDRAALLGTGEDAEPLGLDNVDGVPTTDDVGDPDYDVLIDGVAAVRKRNFAPGRYIGSVRDDTYLAKLKDDEGRYLEPPRYLDDHLPILDTTKLDDVVSDEGDDEGQSKLYVGQWNALMLGVRLNVQLQLLRERYADTGHLGIVAFFRGDVKVIRPEAFQRLTGVTTS